MEARLPQQMTQYVPRAHEGLTCPIETLSTGSRGRGNCSVVRDQGVSDQKLCLSRVGEATSGAGTGGTLEVAGTSVSSQPVDWLLFPTCTGPLCPSLARVAVLREGRAHT